MWIYWLNRSRHNKIFLRFRQGDILWRMYSVNAMSVSNVYGLYRSGQRKCHLFACVVFEFFQRPPLPHPTMGRQAWSICDKASDWLLTLWVTGRRTRVTVKRQRRGGDALSLIVGQAGKLSMTNPMNCLRQNLFWVQAARKNSLHWPYHTWKL